MEQKEIQEGNQIIHRFMDKPEHIIPELLKYHRSWDWLMPCVEKIYEDCQNGKSIGSAILNIFYTPISASINNVFESVVEYITWYNSLSPSKTNIQ